ncbi:tyrosine-type recombinase/integrase [Pararhizobium mangrovi]|uniref:Site-specific integrase n=1 Tax=Pararhizobium mangrovi TaxID=2590452 RepID=A0A506U2T2_9HYPH|nr:site-specific integrase [Pararhizobium mangrovi]TPW28110.1 site-specific integrase [Pararhizobium mangrovi]
MAESNAKPLTKRMVDQAQPGEQRYHIWDGMLGGFGLRVETSGRKSFVLRYRADGGGRSAPRRFMTIGRYGMLTLDEARKKARLTLSAAAIGQDPAAERQAKRAELRITDLIDLYEREGCFIQRGKRQGEPMKEKTKTYTLARLRNHVVPLLGSKRVGEVGSGDIETFVRDVAAGKTAKDDKVGFRRRIIVRGGDGAARKVVRDLSAVYSFAVRREIVDRNPVERAAVRKTDNQRTRYLSIAEVRRLGKAFHKVASDGANPKAIDIARLWALTGCRRDEIAALKWYEVDLDRGLLVLGATKTGRSIRPLSVAAIAILGGIKRDTDSPYVFPATSGNGHYQGTKRIWQLVKREAGLSDITPHTLRHTMGSTAVSGGEALALTGAILGHANPRSTAIYAHVQHQPMRKAAERASKRIAAALGM